MTLGGLTYISLCVCLCGLYGCLKLVYNVYFHPLSRFPGPFWMRASRVPYCNKLLNGSLPFDILVLHKTYGKVVRIAPDELAFSDHDAWKDIMGHRTRGTQQPELPKFIKFYNPLGGPSDIVNSTGHTHSVLRRMMSHGFSKRSLEEQEQQIKQYIDFLIQRLHEKCVEPVDIMSWYNYTTFDVVGDLAFGEPFGCLSTSDYHPWVKNIFTMARVGCIFQVASFFPLMKTLLVLLLSSKSLRARREQHQRLTRKKLLRRMELGRSGGRADLVDNLIRKKDEIGLTLDELLKNCGVLIIGGSETTATLLSGVTYLLLVNPAALCKLSDEVRSSFQTEEEIDFTSVDKLKYMLACLNEAFRMYPPVPGGLPRQTPQGGATISGERIPERVSLFPAPYVCMNSLVLDDAERLILIAAQTIVAIHQWATYHNEKHFRKPFEFRPERWLGDPEFADDHRDAMQPFHIGPRNCLGRNLAYVEMRAILARVIWNFDMKLDDSSANWMDKQKVYILWEKGPLIVHLRPVARR